MQHQHSFSVYPQRIMPAKVRVKQRERKIIRTLSYRVTDFCVESRFDDRIIGSVNFFHKNELFHKPILQEDFLFI